MSAGPGIQGEPGERGPTGDHGQTGEQGPRGPRASTFVTRNLVMLFLLISFGNVASFIAMGVGFNSVIDSIVRDRQRQTEALCQVARDNRLDTNALKDAMRNILTAAARTSGSDPARTELLLSQVPANRPSVECSHGTVTTTVVPE